MSTQTPENAPGPQGPPPATAPQQSSPSQSKPSGPSSGPESLDGVLSTTRPRGWLALATIAAVVLIVLIWSIVATIPQQITVPAAVSVDAVRTTVVSPVAGQVTVPVSTGDSVTAGKEIATVKPFDGGSDVVIEAPIDGTIGPIEVTDGQGVEPGTEITAVVRDLTQDAGIVVVTYLPPSQAELFNAGDDVDVIISDIATSRQYSVPAEVSSVAVTPSNEAAVATETGSQEFASQLAQQGGGVVYRVALTLSAASGDKPQTDVQAGEIVQIVNTYAQPHPIELLFGGR